MNTTTTQATPEFHAPGERMFFMQRKRRPFLLTSLFFIGAPVALLGFAAAQEVPKKSSYSPVVINEPFPETMRKMMAAKDAILKRQRDLLEARYDLSNRPSTECKMFRGKPVQEGVRVRLPEGMTWEKLAAMSPDEIREKELFPAGFYPLPHPNHPEGGMLFPKFHIDEIKKQEARDLTRFDLDFDLPDHFLPEFPAPMFLTTRPDLGDVSQGKLVTIDNFHEIFNEISTPSRLKACGCW